MLLQFQYKILLVSFPHKIHGYIRLITARTCSTYNFIYHITVLLPGWYSKVLTKPGFIASSIYTCRTVCLIPPWAVILSERRQWNMIHFWQCHKAETIVLYTERLSDLLCVFRFTTQESLKFPSKCYTWINLGILWKYSQGCIVWSDTCIILLILNAMNTMKTEISSTIALF